MEDKGCLPPLLPARELGEETQSFKCSCLVETSAQILAQLRGLGGTDTSLRQGEWRARSQGYK